MSMQEPQLVYHIVQSLQMGTRNDPTITSVHDQRAGFS
jgi:hypothetical protein